MIAEDQTELHVFDFKTSRSRRSQSQADSSAGQLLLYRMLLRNNLSTSKPLSLRFDVLTKTKTPEIQHLHVAAATGSLVRQLHVIRQAGRRSIARTAG